MRCLQTKPGTVPGPWVFGASQSVKICCQCYLFIYLFIFLHFFIHVSVFTLVAVVVVGVAAASGWAQKCTSNTKQQLWTAARELRVHIVYFTHLLARRRYCVLLGALATEWAASPAPNSILRHGLQLACLVLSYVFQLRLATPCS